MFFGAVPMFFGAVPMFLGQCPSFWGIAHVFWGIRVCFGSILMFWAPFKRDQCVCKARDASAMKNKQQNNEKMSLRET
jgi:hypothetical protein